MATVVFAIGSRPGLDAHQARALAELLGRERNLAAQRLAPRIREQADRDPDRGEMSEDIELDGDEAQAMLALLEGAELPEDEPAYAHVRDELRREHPPPPD